ncbi:MAG: MBL fold metallo-hydrolase [Candidatus Magasanikbacteria bacterium]|nr:MBL fold metallo-hydrolase [Candidatus Magasanikbacteria bacterium]
MRITKFGHSCLLVEEGRARILIDPGVWSTIPELTNLDAILVTHEHQDHLGIENIKKLLLSNPNCIIYTNAGVGKKLAEAGVAYQNLGNKQVSEVAGVKIEGVGEKHAFIYSTLPVVDNTGYLIAGRLFHPGDALNVPNIAVDILACPIAAPWMKLADMLDYGLQVKPQVIFPTHDAFLKPANPYYTHAEREFKQAGIEWMMLEDGKSREI